MNGKRTPTPWSLDGMVIVKDGIRIACVIGDSEEARENAAFIVSAANTACDFSARDHFAGRILPKLCDLPPSIAATRAYQFADAMMAARSPAQ